MGKNGGGGWVREGGQEMRGRGMGWDGKIGRTGGREGAMGNMGWREGWGKRGRGMGERGKTGDEREGG